MQPPTDASAPEHLQPIAFHLPPDTCKALTRALRAFGHRRNRPGSRSLALGRLVTAALTYAKENR